MSERGTKEVALYFVSTHNWERSRSPPASSVPPAKLYIFTFVCECSQGISDKVKNIHSRRSTSTFEWTEFLRSFVLYVRVQWRWQIIAEERNFYGSNCSPSCPESKSWMNSLLSVAKTISAGLRNNGICILLFAFGKLDDPLPNLSTKWWSVMRIKIYLRSH